jgi:hypothetical protein
MRRPFNPHSYFGLISLAIPVLFILSACTDTAVSPMSPAIDSPVNMDDCPPELTRDNGTCWVNDPTEYNEYVEMNGSMPSMEDLINIDDSIIQEQESSFLTQEGSGKYYVYVNETKRIGVRAVNQVGAPVPGIRVTFEIIQEEASDPKGSTISAMISETDQYGVASIEVNAGPEPTYFKLFMEASDTTTMVYRISVIQPNILEDGDIRTIPPAQRCALIDLSGNYQITNEYELGRFLGDDVFNALEFINRALTDPGGLIGDWIRDRIGGFIGDAVRGIVRDVVNNLLRSANLPEWGRGALNAIADITSLLTNLEINANMRLGKVQGPDCEIPGVHTWEQLVFRWAGNDCGAFGGGNCGEHIVNLTEVGVSVSESEFDAIVVNPSVLISEVEIGEHELNLNIGVVIIALMENVILPQRSGVRSFGELIERVVPCDRFGDLAASLVSGIPFIGSGVRSLATDACRDGVRALGNDLTRRLINQIEVDTFKIKGRADFINRDGMPGAEIIENGRWEGDPNSNDYLQGDFSGTRL